MLFESINQSHKEGYLCHLLYPHIMHNRQNMKSKPRIIITLFYLLCTLCNLTEPRVSSIKMLGIASASQH